MSTFMQSVARAPMRLTYPTVPQSGPYITLTRSPSLNVWRETAIVGAARVARYRPRRKP